MLINRNLFVIIWSSWSFKSWNTITLFQLYPIALCATVMLNICYFLIVGGSVYSALFLTVVLRCRVNRDHSLLSLWKLCTLTAFGDITEFPSQLGAFINVTPGTKVTVWIPIEKNGKLGYVYYVGSVLQMKHEFRYNATRMCLPLNVFFFIVTSNLRISKWIFCAPFGVTIVNILRCS